MSKRGMTITLMYANIFNITKNHKKKTNVKVDKICE